jgi:hypothetical protein
MGFPVVLKVEERKRPWQSHYIDTLHPLDLNSVAYTKASKTPHLDVYCCAPSSEFSTTPCYGRLSHTLLTTKTACDWVHWHAPVVLETGAERGGPPFNLW